MTALSRCWRNWSTCPSGVGPAKHRGPRAAGGDPYSRGGGFLACAGEPVGWGDSTPRRKTLPLSILLREEPRLPLALSLPPASALSNLILSVIAPRSIY